jgi:hypothetical protein
MIKSHLILLCLSWDSTHTHSHLVAILIICCGITGLVFKSSLFYLIMAPKYESSDVDNFITTYCYNCSTLVIVVNLLLCLICKLNFTIGMYCYVQDWWEKKKREMAQQQHRFIKNLRRGHQLKLQPTLCLHSGTVTGGGVPTCYSGWGVNPCN